MTSVLDSLWRYGDKLMAYGKRHPYVGVAMIALALILLPWVAGLVGNAWVRILDFALLYILLAIGLNIVIGYAGLLDLGYIAFYAVGAYLAGFLASPQFATILASFADKTPAFGAFLTSVLGAEVAANGIHLSLWIVLPLGALVAAIAGVILGFPVLRLRGDYLAIVTLGFGEIVRIFMNNLNSPINITNGPQGIQNIDPVHLGGVSFGGVRGHVEFLGLGFHPTQIYYYLFLVLVILAIVVCIRLEKSRLGRAWIAIREDEVAAKAIGIDTRNVKLLAFAIGASFGGLSGVLFASFQQFVSPESFTLQESVLVVAMVVLGGMGHIPGVILGAVLLVLLPETLRYVLPSIQIGFLRIDAELMRQLFFALGIVLVMLFRPHGLLPANKTQIHFDQKRKTALAKETR